MFGDAVGHGGSLPLCTSALLSSVVAMHFPLNHVSRPWHKKCTQATDAKRKERSFDRNETLDIAHTVSDSSDASGSGA